MTTLTLIRPDDWHLHLRDGAALAAVLPDTARQMGRAIIMPNLKPPVTTVEAAAAYRERILAALPAGSRFEPLMTLYLTDNTSAEEVRKARASGFVHGIKLYPAVPPPIPTLVSAVLIKPCRRWKPWPNAACRCWCMVK